MANANYINSQVGTCREGGIVFTQRTEEISPKGEFFMDVTDSQLAEGTYNGSVVKSVNSKDFWNPDYPRSLGNFVVCQEDGKILAYHAK